MTELSLEKIFQQLNQVIIPPIEARFTNKQRISQRTYNVANKVYQQQPFKNVNEFYNKYVLLPATGTTVQHRATLQEALKIFQDQLVSGFSSDYAKIVNIDVAIETPITLEKLKDFTSIIKRYQPDNKTEQAFKDALDRFQNEAYGKFLTQLKTEKPVYLEVSETILQEVKNKEKDPYVRNAMVGQILNDQLKNLSKLDERQEYYDRTQQFKQLLQEQEYLRTFYDFDSFQIRVVLIPLRQTEERKQQIRDELLKNKGLVCFKEGKLSQYNGPEDDQSLKQQQVMDLAKLYSSLLTKIWSSFTKQLGYKAVSAENNGKVLEAMTFAKPDYSLTPELKIYHYFLTGLTIIDQYSFWVKHLEAYLNPVVSSSTIFNQQSTENENFSLQVPQSICINLMNKPNYKQPLTIRRISEYRSSDKLNQQETQVCYWDQGKCSLDLLIKRQGKQDLMILIPLGQSGDIFGAKFSSIINLTKNQFQRTVKPLAGAEGWLTLLKSPNTDLRDLVIQQLATIAIQKVDAPREKDAQLTF